MSRYQEQIDSISAISEKDKSEKINGLWQQLLDLRDQETKKTLSPTDEKVSSIAKEISPNRQIPISSNLNSSEINKIDRESLNLQKSENKKREPGKINLQWNNIQLACKIDSLYSQKIFGEGNKIKEKLDLQKKLLDLKALLPKDLSSKEKLKLSDKAKALAEEITTKYNLNLDLEDLTSLRGQLDSNLDTLKLEIQHGFTELQNLNHERMLVFHLASRQKDEKDQMVRNQTAR